MPGYVLRHCEAFFVSSSSNNIMNGAFPSTIETNQQHHLLEDYGITMTSDTTLVFILTRRPSPFQRTQEADRKCYCIWAVFLGVPGSTEGLSNLNKHALHPPDLTVRGSPRNVCPQLGHGKPSGVTMATGLAHPSVSERETDRRTGRKYGRGKDNICRAVLENSQDAFHRSISADCGSGPC